MSDAMILVDKDGIAVKKGQEIVSFRGEGETLLGWREPHKPGSTGRVYTSAGGEYFPEVYGLTFVPAPVLVEVPLPVPEPPPPVPDALLQLVDESGAELRLEEDSPGVLELVVAGQHWLLDREMAAQLQGALLYWLLKTPD